MRPTLVCQSISLPDCARRTPGAGRHDRDADRRDVPERPGRNVQKVLPEIYASEVEVAITALRAALSSWIERARAGEEVVVTDRGIPVARLVAVDSAPLLDRLTQQGVLSRPSGPRPVARHAVRVRATGSVSDLVGDERR